jgi:hypothetical protein
MKHSLIQVVPSDIIEMVKLSGLRSALQRGLSCYTSAAYQDRKPELGSGVDGFNERLSALESMAVSQAFMEASGQAEPKDHERQGRIWKGIAQSFEEFGVVDRDGGTPNVVGALKWRLSQDSPESSPDEAEAIAKVGTLSAETVKKMRDRSALARFQHRSEIGEDACMRYLSAEPIFDEEPIGWADVWERIKASSERNRIRTVKDADELINDLFLLANA